MVDKGLDISDLDMDFQFSGTDGRTGSSHHLFLVQPTRDYETFERYIGHLNKLIQKQLPFLKAKFGITSLTISTVLPGNPIQLEALKRKLVNLKIAQAAVLV